MPMIPVAFDDIEDGGHYFVKYGNQRKRGIVERISTFAGDNKNHIVMQLENDNGRRILIEKKKHNQWRNIRIPRYGMETESQSGPYWASPS
jgi:hypothetical protein